MNWDEKAQSAAVVDRHALYDEGIDGVFFGGFGNESDAQDFGFRYGARWQREALLSDESVERAARVVTPRLYWNYADWGEASECDREEARIIARKVLTAAIGDDDE